MTAAKKLKYEAHHYSMTRRDYEWAIQDGRRFETITGDPLPTLDAVREAMRRDKEVVSR